MSRKIRRTITKTFQWFVVFVIESIKLILYNLFSLLFGVVCYPSWYGIQEYTNSRPQFVLFVACKRWMCPKLPPLYFVLALLLVLALGFSNPFAISVLEGLWIIICRLAIVTIILFCGIVCIAIATENS